MSQSVYDFKEFYASPVGHVVARAIDGALRDLWPDMTDRRVAVFGYGAPFVATFSGTDRLVFLMPPDQGAYPWPDGAKNLVAIAERDALPIESNSLDGVVVLHTMEFTHNPEAHLDEVWRVLKSNGRVLVIVPNRIGFWVRAEWTPFGMGTPFSLSQLYKYLREALFIPERHKPILYALPLRWRLSVKLAGLFEKYGRHMLPSLAGLHVVEASKQVYAGMAIPTRDRARVRPEPVPVGMPTQFDGDTTGQ